MALVEKFTFQVEKIYFHNEAKSYYVAKTTKGDTVTGIFAAVVGNYYTADGVWETHKTYGRQFKIESASMARMTTATELGCFLAVKLKGKGVGDAVIGHLVTACEEYKLDLEALLDEHKRTELVECVGKRNASKIDIILTNWPTIKPQADLVGPLLGYGLSAAMANECVNIFGSKAVDVVTNHPYSLILKVPGVSFLTADRIAMKVGRTAKTAPVRLHAALATGLREATANGDLGVPRQKLLTQTMPLVNEAIIENGKRKLAPGVDPVVPEPVLMQALDDLVSPKSSQAKSMFSEQLVESTDAKGTLVVWLKSLVLAEDSIALRLTEFNAEPRLDLVRRIPEFSSLMGATLAPEQQAAVEMALTHPVSVVTGGPGCGKSYLLKVILTALDAAGLRGSLAAPTGKAAKRITESTGRPAQTLHSLIGYRLDGKCTFNKSSTMASKYLVIDEASMVDTELMAAALNAAATDCRIIIVGDFDQLPSVGPGQVLRDIINSGEIPVTRLTKGFRFSGGIAQTARDITAGKYPTSSDDGKFVLVETEEPAQALLESVKQLIKEGVKEDEIQVLSPTHKGDAGCISLNKAMQALLNPDAVSATAGQRLQRDAGDVCVGDRVLQTKNDAPLNLVNGDIGWIDSIGTDSDTVVLSLADRAAPVKMSRQQAVNLNLAYAITVHKSQGAEAPYVLMALDKSATFMLRRNLVYTGVTRGSKKVILFAPPNTLASAVRRGEPIEGSRRTMLVSKIQKAFSSTNANAYDEDLVF